MGKLPNFTVIDSDGGTAVPDQSVQSGDLAVQPADPTREGYSFLGWYHSWDLSVSVDFSEPIWGDSSFVAKWKEDAISVTFDSDGGSAVQGQKVKKGETVSRPSHPAKAGFTFFGWFDGDTRYDFRKPVEKALTLKARWRPVGKQTDLKTAIGSEGQFDGELSKAIGVSGTYDSAQFRVLPTYPYPSIRLELIENPDAAIVFSSLPVFRNGMVNFAGLVRHEDGMILPYRFASLTHFEQKCVPDQITRITGKDFTGIGQDEISYILYGDGGKKLLANDFVSYFPSSTGIIHFEYPEENADLTKNRLIQALSTITFDEGNRPAIAYAAYDLKQTDVSSTDNVITNLTKAGTFFGKNLSDLRLNAELAEHIYLSAEMDINQIAADMLVAEQSQGNASLSTDKQAAIKTELDKLLPYGFKSSFSFDDSNNAFILISYDRGAGLERYQKSLPASYGLLIDSYKAFERDENPSPSLEDLEDTEHWLRQFRAATELCLVAANPLVAGDAPEWRDPVLRQEREGMRLSSFNSSIFCHAVDETTLNQAVYDAWKIYEEEIAEISAGLPDGYFAAHIGPYADFVLNFKNKINERGLVPFTYEETAAILEEMDYYNSNLPSQSD